MPKKYKLSYEQVQELEGVRKKNKDKNIDDRLKALLMYADGMKHKDIANKTDFAQTYVTELAAKYRKHGIDAICGNNYKGNRRNIGFDEEATLLEAFKTKAESGQVIEVSEIKKAYEEACGITLSDTSGQIYRVLKRHGWRKVMPRSKHPNKASEAEINASKKLTTWLQN